jgi:hypothetical protein
MSIPLTVTEILRDHVTLEIESIDRMYLNVYVPQLQHARGVAAFFRYHRGQTFASSVLMAPISHAFVTAIVICQGILIQLLSASSSTNCRQGDPPLVGKEHHLS